MSSLCALNFLPWANLVPMPPWTHCFLWPAQQASGSVQHVLPHPLECSILYRDQTIGRPPVHWQVVLAISWRSQWHGCGFQPSFEEKVLIWKINDIASSWSACETVYKNLATLTHFQPDFWTPDGQIQGWFLEIKAQPRLLLAGPVWWLRDFQKV